MKLTYTPQFSPIKNCYILVIEYEHGDADSYHQTEILLEMDEESVIRYIQKCNEVADLIQKSRNTGTSLPKDFVETNTKFENEKYIPVESDCYTKMHMANYYAAMWIASIRYIDNEGNKFIVSVV